MPCCVRGRLRCYSCVLLPMFMCAPTVLQLLTVCPALRYLLRFVCCRVVSPFGMRVGPGVGDGGAMCTGLVVPVLLVSLPSLLEPCY